MKLYQSIGPNPRVVTMFIAEKGLSVDRVWVDILAAENRQPPYLAKNPSGGTPVLELDDGSCISEGTAICEYLDEADRAPGLIGATPEERAETRMRMRIVDQQAIVPMTIGFRGAEGHPMFKDRMLCLPDAAAGLKKQAQYGLAAIDKRLGSGPFLAGERFTMADIMLFCFVEFGAQVGQPLADNLTNLKAWHGRVAERPSAAVSANPENGLQEGC